jgi:hypothetical protein
MPFFPDALWTGWCTSRSFPDSINARKCMAMLYTSIFLELLAQIADHSISRIDELQPWNLIPSLQAQSSQAA